MTATITPDLSAAALPQGADGMPLDRSLPAIVVHTALRRELRLAAPLVRHVVTGDLRRAATVTAHLDLVLRLLHHHHENEDLHVWPPLAERAVGEEPALVELMQRQHAALEHHLAEIEAALAAWSCTAAIDARETLAVALEALHATLVEHLAAEERFVLPMAERLLTEAEWTAIAHHGQRAAAGREKLLVFGILAYEGDPAVIATMLADAPRPVRALLPRLALRRYRRHAAAVYGTPTP